MTTRKYLAFDLEIAALIPEDEPNTDWKQYRPLGITCAACAWQGDDGIETRTFHGSASGDLWLDATPTPRMTPVECREMVKDLRYLVDKGHAILTWNGCSFDFDVLAEESGMHAECVELAMNHVDMMLQIHCIKGFPLSLNAAAKGMGLAGKIEGVDGAKAPQMWANGEYAKVLEYVQQDVRTTLEVALAVERRRSLTWISKKGNPNGLAINRWLTVSEALRLPEPNTDWMSDPMPRSKFTTWMEAEIPG